MISFNGNRRNLFLLVIAVNTVMLAQFIFCWYPAAKYKSALGALYEIGMLQTRQVV
jgi:hypothetical protein